MYSGELPNIEDEEISHFSRHSLIKKETLLHSMQQDEEILLSLAESLKLEQEDWLEIQGFLPVGLSNDLPFIDMAVAEIHLKKSLIKDDTSVNNEKIVSIPDYYFYMDASGSHAYLSHLDIKILHQEYRKYSEFPAEIIVDILNIVDLKFDEVSIYA